MAMRLQLVEGAEILEEWSESALQADRNMVYEALFAIGDGSAFLIYDVFGDPRDPCNLIVVVKNDLAMKIRLYRPERSFEIVSVGPFSGQLAAPGWQAELDET